MSGPRVWILEADLFLEITTPTGRRASIYDDLRQDLDGERRYAVVGTPTGRTAGDMKTGQDRLQALAERSRPLEPLPMLRLDPQAEKVPPVVAHAPPARRGRWARG